MHANFGPSEWQGLGPFTLAPSEVSLDLAGSTPKVRGYFSPSLLPSMLTSLLIYFSHFPSPQRQSKVFSLPTTYLPLPLSLFPFLKSRQDHPHRLSPIPTSPSSQGNANPSPPSSVSPLSPPCLPPQAKAGSSPCFSSP